MADFLDVELANTLSGFKHIYKQHEDMNNAVMFYLNVIFWHNNKKRKHSYSFVRT